MMKKTVSLLILGLGALPCSSNAADIDLTKLPPAASKKGVTYESDVRPMLEASCFQCHTGDKPKAGLHLDSLAGVLAGSKEGKVVIPRNAEKSQLLISVARLDPETEMPPKPKPGQRRGAPPGGPESAAGAGGPGGPPAGGLPPGAPGRGGFGPPPKPLTPEQVGLIRAWIAQGSK